jgi:hypothetical protein
MIFLLKSILYYGSIKKIIGLIDIFLSILYNLLFCPYSFKQFLSK